MHRQLTLAVVLLLAGCASSSPPVPGASGLPGDPASVPPSATVTAPSPTGGLSASQPASAGAPPGFPVPPGAVPAPQPAGSSLGAWTLDAEPPDVYQFYLRELPAAGFVIGGAFPGGDAAIIRFSRDGESYQLELTGHDPVHVALGPLRD